MIACLDTSIVRATGAQTPATPPPATYREELRIGKVDGTGPDVFGRVVALEVDDRKRIYVLDSQNHQVAVFDSLGRVVRAFGKRGQGPGEFESPMGLAWLRPTELVVVHLGGYAVFDTAGVFLRSHRRPSSLIQMPYSGTAANGVVCDVGRLGRDTTLFFAALRDSVLSRLTVGRPPRPTVEISPGSTTAAPFATFPTYQTDCSRRAVWVIDPADSLVRLIGLSGDTLRRIAHGFTRRQISATERDAAIQGLAARTGASVRALEQVTPHTGSFFGEAFVSGDGDVWIAPRQNPAGGFLYHVIAPDGRVSTARLRPFGPAIRPMIRGALVYGVVTDMDGVNFVVRLRREARPGSD
jgi:hypothetical protein